MTSEKIFCDDCGAKLPKGTKFCENCGATTSNVPPPPQRQVYTPSPPQQTHRQTYQQPVSPAQPVAYAPQTPIYRSQKSVGIALLLNILLIVGLGQIYAGRTARGVAFMAGYYSLITGVFLSIFNYWYVAFIIFPILAFALAMWSHVDAYLVTQEYNKKLVRGQIR
ncbi:MAG: zinc ribbon domain-containing protein [Candidatus Heimdallarchaeota archaeon]|nr:zinc ribbon domain-containing protein [Candidatus Heimdallarchaeota archaeon]MCK4252845.1 zinc ribbon domain-containing protein [Candidatus Heimdallarchaeota archaeon]